MYLLGKWSATISGAIGVQIRVAGKIAGVQRSRFQKFSDGFIVHSGDYAEKLVDKGYAQANLRPGVGGVQVKIMNEASEEFIVDKILKKQKEQSESVKETEPVETAEETEPVETAEETEPVESVKEKPKTE